MARPLITLAVVRCSNARCKPAWRCRRCDRKVCEHRCSRKTPDGLATCGRCLLAADRKAVVS